MLAATQDVVQDRLPCRLVTQEADLLRGAARAKRATRNRVQDRELDQSKPDARLHSIECTVARAAAGCYFVGAADLGVTR